jgi:hypothetical protein
MPESALTWLNRHKWLICILSVWLSELHLSFCRLQRASDRISSQEIVLPLPVTPSSGTLNALKHSGRYTYQLLQH